MIELAKVWDLGIWMGLMLIDNVWQAHIIHVLTK